MKKMNLIAILQIAGTIVFAQNPEEHIDTRPLNSISINLLGDASIISVNIERQFLISPIFILASKLGIGYNEEFKPFTLGPSSPTEKYLTIPHHITGNLGKGRHFFEFGLGGTKVSGNTSQPYLLYPILGYRMLPLISNKINFRIFGQIPFSQPEDILFVPIGLNVGVSF